MKIQKWFFAVSASIALASAASGANYVINNSAWDNGQVIQDNDLSGWSDTLAVSAADTIISGNVRVNLNLTGGYNGDLYGYLSYNDGTSTGFTVLLNRVGVQNGNIFGYSTAGMNVWLADSGTVNIHDVVNPTSGGTYLADGRNTSPIVNNNTDAVNLYNTSQGTLNSQFVGLNPNGTWTLFFADVASGDQTTVAGWSLSFDAIPEPAHVAMGIFAALFGAVQLGRYLRQRSAKRA